MFVVHSYPLAVVFCVLTMFCWGSWANTRKLARKDWRFELFYWDYAVGVLLLTLILGLTLGGSGTEGRSFSADLSQASGSSIGSALVGGAISIWPTSCSWRRSRLPGWRLRFQWVSDLH